MISSPSFVKNDQMIKIIDSISCRLIRWLRKQTDFVSPQNVRIVWVKNSTGNATNCRTPASSMNSEKEFQTDKLLDSELLFVIKAEET